MIESKRSRKHRKKRKGADRRHPQYGVEMDAKRAETLWWDAKREMFGEDAEWLDDDIGAK